MTNEADLDSDLTGSHVLVTGAAGFIGSALVTRLVEAHGCSVVGVDNERSGDWTRLEVACERDQRAIESLSVDDWAELTEGADFVFHLAAEKYNSSKSTPERVLETNVDAFLRLIQGVGRVARAKIVFTSSLYAYGSLGPEPMGESDVLAPTTTYGASKAMGEYLLRVAERDSGLRWTVARLFFIYGPRQYAKGGYKSVILSNFERIMSGEPPTIYGDGRQALDYVYISDCINALIGLAASESDSLVANVATGSAVTVQQLTEMMLETSGSELSPVYTESDWTAGSVRAGRRDAIEHSIGWRPTVDLDHGLEQVWTWMQERVSA